MSATILLVYREKNINHFEDVSTFLGFNHNVLDYCHDSKEDSGPSFGTNSIYPDIIVYDSVGEELLTIDPYVSEQVETFAPKVAIVGNRELAKNDSGAHSDFSFFEDSLRPCSLAKKIELKYRDILSKIR